MVFRTPLNAHLVRRSLTSDYNSEPYPIAKIEIKNTKEGIC